MGILTGSVALITGGSRGLGRAVAEQFVVAGANTVMCSRSRSDVIVEEDVIRARSGGPGNGHIYGLGDVDVGNESQVNGAIAFTRALYGRLDILVCCAGIQGSIGRFENITVPDWQDVLRTNLIGTMLCCHAVVPIMRNQHHGKIIALSGGGATKPYPNFAAYATSKAAIVGFIATLAAELQGSGVDANTVAPGALNTAMLADVLQAGPEAVGDETYMRAILQRQSGGDSIEEAAALITYLASPACDGISGKLISAKWDNWRELPLKRNALQHSPQYTMRRVL